MDNPSQNLMKPNFVMLIGLPGAGKSTFADTINPDHVILSSDDVIQGVADQMGKTYSEVFSEVIDAANKVVEAQIAVITYQKAHVVIDRTNLSRTSRKRTMNLMKHKAEYHKVAVVFNTEAETCLTRLQERNKSGKVINNQTFKQMLKSFEWPVEQEGFDEIVVV